MSSPNTRLDFDHAGLEAVSQRLGVRTVVLFGSFSTGSPPPGRDSDVDLAVSCSADRSRPSLWALYRELDPIFVGRTLDIVFLADADPLFRWEILAEGALLHGDPIEFLETRAIAFRDFVDSADLRALERTLFEKKIAFIRRRLNAAA